MKRLILISGFIVAVLGLTALVKPLDAMNAMALGAAGSVQAPISVTTTSSATFVPSGSIRLTCNQPTYYKVGTSTVTVSSASYDGINYGNFTSSGATLQRPSWISITAGSSQWLALLIKSGVNGVCSVEQMGTNGLTGSFTTLAASSTLDVTGAATFGSTVTTTGITKLGGALDAGAVIANGTLNATGATVLATTLDVTGAATAASLTLPSSTALAGIKWGTITLNGGSPATGTATVLSGMQCLCTPFTNAADGVTKCPVSSTTLTATGPNSSTGVINYLCIK